VNLNTAFMLLSLLWVGSEIALARMRRSGATDAQRDRSSLRTLWITIAISVNAGIFVGLQTVGRVHAEIALIPIIGLILIAGGLVVRWIAILSLKRQFTVDVAITEGHQLIRTGLYRLVRHPAYSGSLLSFLGLGLVFSNVISVLVISVPVSAAFLHRIRIEEEALVEAFGDEYVCYRAETKRLIPGIY
jgi:protein-S-isoprenylcysteine O-methyltransferase Ste14